MLFSFVFLPHKPRLHALGPIVLRLSAIYEYGVCHTHTVYINECLGGASLKEKLCVHLICLDMNTLNIKFRLVSKMSSSSGFQHI